MANLIDNTYFIGDIMLPNKLTDGGNLSNIDTYIAKYERQVLINMLGYDLYKALKAQIDSDPQTFTDPWTDFVNGAEYSVGDYTIKWNGLINSDKQSFIAYYIYFYYMRDLITSTTSSGEILSKVVNGFRITPADKMANAWSRFLELYGSTQDSLYCPSAYRYLYENEDSFDLWLFKPEGTVNKFGI